MSKSISGLVVMLVFLSLLAPGAYAEKTAKQNVLAKELATFLKMANRGAEKLPLQLDSVHKLLTLNGVKVDKGSSLPSNAKNETEARKMISSMSDKDKNAISALLRTFSESYREVSQLPMPPVERSL